MGRTESGALLQFHEQSNLPQASNLIYQTVSQAFVRVLGKAEADIKIEPFVRKTTKQNLSAGFVYNIFDSDRIYLQFFHSGKSTSHCILNYDIAPSIKKNFATDFCNFFRLSPDDAKLVRQILKLNDPELCYEYLESLAKSNFGTLSPDNGIETKFTEKAEIVKDVRNLALANKIANLKVVESVTMSARTSGMYLERFLLILRQEKFNKWTYNNYELFHLNESATPELIIPKNIFSFCDDDLLILAKDQLYVYRNKSEFQRQYHPTKPVGLYRINIESKTVSEVQLQETNGYQTAIAMDLGYPTNSSIETLELKTATGFINHSNVGPFNIDSFINKFRLLDQEGRAIGKVVINGVSIINYFDNQNYLHVVVAEEQYKFLGGFPNNITGVDCFQYLHFKKVKIPNLTTSST